MLIYTTTFSVIFKQIEIMVIALISFRPIKNIMNLTISNQANIPFQFIDSFKVDCGCYKYLCVVQKNDFQQNKQKVEEICVLCVF